MYEYNRSNQSAADKDREKQEKAKAERDALNASLKALDIRLQRLEKVVQANSQQIAMTNSTPEIPNGKPLISKWRIFGM